MSLPTSKQTHAYWQRELLEAIRQRDAFEAAKLSQRCVHRYGMNTLEELLEQLSEEQGEPPLARDWLLPLLESPLSSSSAVLQPSLKEPKENPQPPEFQPRPVVPSDPPASAKLDEAFAPLEIAFPPLPKAAETTGEEADESESSGSMSTGLRPIASPDEKAIHAEAPTSTPQPQGDGQEVLDSPSHSLPAPSATDPLEAEIPAPIPIFQRGYSSEEADLSRKEDGRSQWSQGIPPAPISPELAPWLVWIPKPSRPRQR